MESRKTILHIIDSLGRGGAETLLVGVVNSSPELNHIIISLKPINEFTHELKEIKIYYLNFNWYHSVPKSVVQVKKIIAQHKIDVIHAHLFWSVIVSRLACPKYIKLINSYHAVLYGNININGKYPFYARLLDKLTYKASIFTLCVSKEVQKNIKENVGIEHNTYVLHNFIDDSFYNNFRPSQESGSTLRMVAVGNLKKDKNYKVILDAFEALNSQGSNKLSLDIYGKGPLLKELENSCRKKNIINIHLKGAVNNISTLLTDYDIYIISSTSEGFGLSVIEAMAVGLPVLVSDIPTLREVTGGNALFFNPLSSVDLIDKIKSILNGFVDIKSLAKQGHEYSKKYTKKAYLERLMQFYLN